MATSKNFHDRMMERLASVGEFSSRKMMGEYCVFHRGKMVAEMCDDRFLLKPSASVIAFMPDAQREYPYEGSKTLMLVTDLSQDISFLKELFTRMYDELPEPKKKKASDGAK